MPAADTVKTDRVGGELSKELDPRLDIRHQKLCLVCQLDDESQQVIADRYLQGDTIADLCEEYNLPRRSLTKHLSVMGLRRRKFASVRDILADVLDECLSRKSLDTIVFRGSDVVQLMKLQAELNRELGDSVIPTAIVQYLPLANQIVYADDPQALRAISQQIQERIARLRTGDERPVGEVGPDPNTPPAGVSNGPAPAICDSTTPATDAEFEIEATIMGPTGEPGKVL